MQKNKKDEKTTVRANKEKINFVYNSNEVQDGVYWTMTKLAPHDRFRCDRSQESISGRRLARQAR